MSVRRNELIADMFSRLGKVERIGMGIRKMVDLAVMAGNKQPEFETDFFFKATFHRPPEHARKGMADSPSTSITESDRIKDRLKDMLKDRINLLSENDMTILTEILAHPKVTAIQLSATLGINERNVRKNLARLVNGGIIRRVGSRKTGYWEIIES